MSGGRNRQPGSAPWPARNRGRRVNALNEYRRHRFVEAIDNEPENLAAIEAADPANEILLLHADTLYMSPPRPLARADGGRTYDADRLAAEFAMAG